MVDEDFQEQEQEREDEAARKKEEEELAEEPKKKVVSKSALEKRKRLKALFSKVFSIFLVLFLFVTIIGISYFTFTKMKAKDEIITDKYVFEFPKPQKMPPKGVFKFKAKDFNISLDDATTIGAEIHLSYDDKIEKLKKELEGREMEIADLIFHNISEKGLYDVNTADKREFGLKKELINEINSILENGKIDNLFFTKFYITPSRP